MNPVKLFTLLTTLALLALAGCAPSAMVVFSLQNTDCASCGEKARQAVAMRQGVTEARFDKATAEIHVAYNPEQTDESALLKAVQGCWSEVKVGAGLGTYQSMDKYEASADMKVISEAGEDVDITKHLVPGKVTVVDFMADWCGPCRVVGGVLADLLKARPDLAVRTVNVGDWGTPAANRYLTKASDLPTVKIYTPGGNLFSEISGLKIQEMSSDINRAAAEGASGF